MRELSLQEEMENNLRIAKSSSDPYSGDPSLLEIYRILFESVENFHYRLADLEDKIARLSK